ncbi:putative receptor-like serine/threonine-protein kinase-like [Dorcoceras hygrometricum]|nr:putative receptor-like serine/threonine-protein kinase-like [Dorcoceras hygrometricum]
MVDSGNVLTSKTPILGQKLYVIVILTIVIVIAVFLTIFLLLRWNRKSRRRYIGGKRRAGLLPLAFEEIGEVNESGQVQAIKVIDENSRALVLVDDVGRVGEIESESKKESSESYESSVTQSESSSAFSASTDGLSNAGWGRWYSLNELLIATNQFSGSNVIGEGGYGVVYRGDMQDGSFIAVKNLLNNKGQAEKEFRVEVEAIGKVRHKNLVGLIGYCAEGAQRLLVYEYIDNGNLEQWLHGEVGKVSPLTWEIRMKIASGTARGLAYLHEGLEPKVVHRDVKSSNILLDKKWNPKVSDFGLAKLLGSDKTHVTTRVMGTFGYVSPEYASSGMLNEASDVYSYGVLLMEIITGRSPVDYSRPPGEMNLIDWFKGMISSRRSEELVDAQIEVPPPPRALKRILLVCLRCIDLDTNKRPKMGQIVHMLEADEFPYRKEPRSAGDTALQPLTVGGDKIQAAQKEMLHDDEGKP